MSTDTMIGKEISGRYEVLSVLGRGGIGTVYKARQKHLDRLCALKLLFEKHAVESDNLARFEREARVSAGLQHENIVSVFDFGVAEEGFAFLVMELVLGENLETLIQTSGRLEPAAAIPVFLCIANALAYAHERSVVHRDLKPSNVMIARDENGNSQIKLVDFGLAKSFCQDDSNLTSQGHVLGTPAYMSPEQCL
ncbi:MAG: serine/threonine protein kinase, partial [Cyanobacteria bacterium HKST-UBA02]|nr:serine/threonine protein kinase [Cyanobacteria bacterium HKST-UBA02]